jgi:DegV family protein with EDD domain
MKVKVFTDVHTFIPDDLASKYDIGFVEFSLLIDGKAYKEKSELDREEFINTMGEMDPYPTSSMPNPSDYLEAFQEAEKKGYDEIIYIGITVNLSQSQNSAKIAAKQLKKAKATVYDSEIMGSCQGIMALSAAHLFQKGKSMDEVIKYLDSIKKIAYGAGLSSSFEVLFKTGRVKKGAAISAISTLMRLKPMFEFNYEKGITSLGGGRGYKGAIKILIDNFLEKTDENLEYILIMNDALAPELMKKVEKEIKKIRKIKETFYWPITPMAAHTLGKGCVVAVIGPSWEVE